MTCPCRETCIAIMRSQANTYSENLSGSQHFVNECAARIRALPCSCKYTVRVPRETVEHFANYWTVGDESGEAAHWTEAERKHCKVMFDLLNTKEPT